MFETVYVNFHAVQYLKNIGPTMKQVDWLILMIFILFSGLSHVIKEIGGVLALARNFL